MATYTKKLLSGSTNGKNVKVVATSSTGTTIHTAVAGTSSLDEIWLWAVNHDTVARLLTIQWGETTDPDGKIEVSLASQGGLALIIPGLLLQNGLVVYAYAAAANVVMINGFVNEIT